MRAVTLIRGTGKGDADRSMPNPSRLVIKRAFVRRYTACERPWFTLHMDTAALTANVALASDALHEEGDCWHWRVEKPLGDRTS